MKPLLIQGGHIIDPTQGLDDTGNLLIAEGKITWLGKGNASPPHQVYDTLPAASMIVCPGFIDIHCHLRQPGFENQETIATGTRAAARGGFTTVCCMPNTKPPLDNRFTIAHVLNLANSEGKVRVLPIGAVSQGRKGRELANMDEIAAAGAVAFSDDGSPVADAELMRLALEKGRALGLPIIDHSEVSELSADGVMNEGKLSVRLGLKGIPSAAEEIMISRNIDLALFTGSRLHIAHVSSAASVEIIAEAKAKGIRVTAEVTPHHLTLTEEAVEDCGTSAKVNPPLRTQNDIDALIQGLNEGIIDAIATDHAPHTDADKSKDFALAPFGISGLETALGALMGLVNSGKLTLNTLIARLTISPAGIIGDERGSLKIGSPADVTIFDPDKKWTVKPDEFASKGHNTPLAGKTLKGRVMATVYQGKIVYQDDSIKLKESR